MNISHRHRTGQLVTGCVKPVVLQTGLAGAREAMFRVHTLRCANVGSSCHEHFPHPKHVCRYCFAQECSGHLTVSRRQVQYSPRQSWQNPLQITDIFVLHHYHLPTSISDSQLGAMWLMGLLRAYRGYVRPSQPLVCQAGSYVESGSLH